MTKGLHGGIVFPSMIARFLEEQDNMTRVAAIQNVIENDGLAEGAAKKARCNFPDYHWTLEQRGDEYFALLPSDAMLPYVLKNRVDAALLGRKVSSDAANHASSLNALVRELIRSGQI